MLWALGQKGQMPAEDIVKLRRMPPMSQCFDRCWANKASPAVPTIATVERPHNANPVNNGTINGRRDGD